MTITIVSGGTGGHVYPAIALGLELTRQDYDVQFWTDTRGLRYCEDVPLNFKVISGRGLSGNLIQKGLALLFFIRNYLTSLWTLRGSSLVIGFGGYLSLAPLLAAKTLNIPTLIHEQNAVLGLVNRILAPLVDAVAVSYKGTHPLETLTGMPVRPFISNPVRTPSDTLTLVILGGSQGARIFSTLIPQALSTLHKDILKRLHVIQQCRPESVETLINRYKDMGIHATCSTFFKDIMSLYGNASLVISRAGASTLAELMATGTPAILIPLPTSAHNHQMLNALTLGHNGAAIILEEKKLTPESLGEKLLEILKNPAKRLEMSSTLNKQAQDLCVFNATVLLAQLSVKLLQKKRSK